jgi:hypothetical protein
MKLVICIILLDNNYNNIKIIENTWLKNITNIEYFYFIDNKYFNETNNKTNYIYLDNLIIDNHFVIFDWLYAYNYDYVLFTYCESYVNINNLLFYLETLDSTKKLYIGGHGDKRKVNNIEFHFHSYTPGIVLTKNTIDYLNEIEIKNGQLLFNEYNLLCKKTNKDLINLSGVAIGYFCKIYDIELIESDNFNYCNCYGFPCHVNKKNKNKIICCANMTNNNIEEFYNYLLLKPEKPIIKPMTLFICPGGGLGNILFQYFFGYAMNKKYNCPIYYKINYNYWRGDINKYKIFKHLNFLDFSEDEISNLKTYNETNLIYNEINFNTNYNYIINGHYQSYKYFIHLIDDIKQELFSQIPEIYNEMLLKYIKISNYKETCLIHIRRGDYLVFSNIHPLCSDEYYIKAICEINKKKNIKYLIFSDDINYIKYWPIIKLLDYYIVEEVDPEKTILLMSFCDNFIIANSSMSLVAYYLRNNKDAKLIAPSKWFQTGTITYKIDDLILLNENNIII